MFCLYCFLEQIKTDRNVGNKLILFRLIVATEAVGLVFVLALGYRNSSIGILTALYIMYEVSILEFGLVWIWILLWDQNLYIHLYLNRWKQCTLQDTTAMASCAPVHELPQNICGDNQEGMFFHDFLTLSLNPHELW